MTSRPTMKPDDLQHIVDALKRGASTWQLSSPPHGAPARNVSALSVGSPTAIAMTHLGTIVVISMTLDELRRLRAAVDEFISIAEKSP